MGSYFGHSARSQHWHTPIGTPVHRPASTGTSDSLLERYLNRLRIEDPIVDSDAFPEVPSEVNEPEECEDAISQTDWRVCIFKDCII